VNESTETAVADTIPPTPAKIHTGELAIMDRTGDTKILWNRHDPNDVAVARAAFREARSKGFLIYRAEGKDGHQGEQINEFDPDAERLIAIPPMVGG